MKPFSISILLVLLAQTAQSQSNAFGARNTSIGGASVTLSDEYSLFNAIGAMGKLTSHGVFAGYRTRYGIAPFQEIGGGGVFHHHLGNAGISYHKFGDHLFSQQRIGIGIGNKIQMVSLGLGADIIQYHIESVGTTWACALKFGGVAEITPKFLFGAHIFNFNQATISSETEERLPTVIKAGTSYRPTEELMINIEVEKDLGFDEALKIGLEYEIIKRVVVRTGISTRPFTSAFGIGFHPKNLKFDYAFAHDALLGNSNELSLAYLIKK